MNYKFVIAPTNVSSWLEENKASFLPPICNKLMFKGKELSVMFVGGPNQRTDFHYEVSIYKKKKKIIIISFNKNRKDRNFFFNYKEKLKLLPYNKTNENQ